MGKVTTISAGVGGTAAGAAAATLYDLPPWAQPFLDRLATELGIAGIALAVVVGVLMGWSFWRARRYDELSQATAGASTQIAVALEKGVNNAATTTLGIRDIQASIQTNAATLARISDRFDDAHRDQRDALSNIAQSLGALAVRLEVLERGRSRDGDL